MVKIQVDSQGKALSLNGSILEASEGGSGRTISCLNKSGNAIAKGNKVWVEKDGSNYNIINYYGSISNFNTNGFPTINNGIINGFSTSDFITPILNPKFAVMAHSNPWEIKSKINLTELNYFSSIFGGDPGTYLPDLCVTPNNVLGMNLASNTYDYDIAVVTGSTVLSTNTDYWVNFGWTGTVYYAKLSTDDITYTSEISLDSTVGIYNIGSDLRLGFRAGNYFHGSIDLKETYIKINDMMWWTPYASNITKNMQTGIADENIAINSSGNVKVL